MWPGNDLPENEREITLRDTLGGQDLPESAHQLDIKNAVHVRFPERTKGGTAAGPRNPSRSQHTGSKRADAPPRCPPTRMKMRASEASVIPRVLQQYCGPGSHGAGPSAGGPYCFNFMLHQRSKLTAELEKMSLSQKFTRPLLIVTVINHQVRCAFLLFAPLRSKPGLTYFLTRGWLAKGIRKGESIWHNHIQLCTIT